ncbi:hypothetical protein D3C81_2098890 [compost metagenome]
MLSFQHPVSVNTSKESDLASAFTDNHSPCKECLRIETSNTLNCVRATDQTHLVLSTVHFANDDELVTIEFPHRNRRMGCHEDLERRLRFL